MAASLQPLWLRMEKRAEPTMMQEKTMPRGTGEPVSRTGVQRNTKMYIQDSSGAWHEPSSSTWESLKMIRSPSRQLPPKLLFLSP